MPLTERDRRTLKIGGIVAGVILVGFLLFNLLGGGGGGASTASLPSFSPVSPSPSSSASGSTTPNQAPPALAGRDPFLIPPGLGSSSPTGTSSPTGSSTQSSTSSPTLPGNGASTRIGGHTVVLLDVYSVSGTRHAQVEVDGTVYNPPVGGRFSGGEFRLESTSGDCAVLLFGDQSFTLCATPQK